VRGGGSSADESRAASTAYGFRTPLVFAPVKAASVCGVHPAFSAVATAGVSLAPLGARQPPVSTQHGEEPTDRPAAVHRPGRGRRLTSGGGGFPGRFLVRFGCNRCTP
jgi:hypothetical protein